jgi:hypothetical protein
VKRKREMPETLKPWWRKKAFLAGVGTTLILVLGGAAITAKYEEAKARKAAAAVVELNEVQKRITPDDRSIGLAIKEAVKKKDVPLSLQQILDVYDFIVKKIRYLNVSSLEIPKWPSATLADEWGDCKSMGTLLASMLEAIGAKTVIYQWYIPEKKEGHMYIGVYVGDATDKETAKYTINQVRQRIAKRYSSLLRSKYRGKLPELHLRQVEAGGTKGVYLLLDATLGRESIPGTAYVKPFDKMFESRPSKPGEPPKPINVPDID